MYTNIVKMGNHAALRLTNRMLKSAGLRENDRVEVFCQNDSITIRRASVPHRTLEERFTSFYGKPLDEIEPVFEKEVDWGEPEGEEEW